MTSLIKKKVDHLLILAFNPERALDQKYIMCSKNVIFRIFSQRAKFEAIFYKAYLTMFQNLLSSMESKFVFLSSDIPFTIKFLMEIYCLDRNKLSMFCIDNERDHWKVTSHRFYNMASKCWQIYSLPMTLLTTFHEWIYDQDILLTKNLVLCVLLKWKMWIFH